MVVRLELSAQLDTAGMEVMNQMNSDRYSSGAIYGQEQVERLLIPTGAPAGILTTSYCMDDA
jgi:hypothetical protein